MENKKAFLITGLILFHCMGALAAEGERSGCLALNLPTNLFPSVSRNELEQAGVLDPDRFGAACRDSSGMIWGGQAKNDKGMPLLLSPKEALEHCKKIGAELPFS